MAAELHIIEQRRLIDSNGIADGASIYFYATGTTTRVSIYADASLSVPLPNPVVVGAGAMVPDIYLESSLTYRRRIAYFDGTIDDVDPYSPRSGGNAPDVEAIQLACSDTTTLIETGTAKASFAMAFAMTLSEVRAYASTAPLGAPILIDINANGASILSTKLRIDSGENSSVTSSVQAAISNANLPDDAAITIDFDQVGSTVAGAGIIISLIGVRA